MPYLILKNEFSDSILVTVHAVCTRAETYKFQAMQILGHTFRFSLHIGSSAFYISYTCTPFHKMLLRILQNVMGDFSHRLGMSNFKEKHFFS